MNILYKGFIQSQVGLLGILPAKAKVALQFGDQILEILLGEAMLLELGVTVSQKLLVHALQHRADDPICGHLVVGVEIDIVLVFLDGFVGELPSQSHQFTQSVDALLCGSIVLNINGCLAEREDCRIHLVRLTVQLESSGEVLVHALGDHKTGFEPLDALIEGRNLLNGGHVGTAKNGVGH